MEGLPGFCFLPASGASGAPPCGFAMAAIAFACSVSDSSSAPLRVATIARSSPVAFATESTSFARADAALRSPFSFSSAAMRSSMVGSGLFLESLRSLSCARLSFERFSHLRDSLTASS